jgi:hypothetical protein
VRLSFLQLLIQFHSQGKDDSRSVLGFTLNRERRHIATTRNSNHLVGGSLGQYLIPGLSSRRPALHKPSTANQGQATRRSLLQLLGQLGHGGMAQAVALHLSQDRGRMIGQRRGHDPDVFDERLRP